MSQTALLQFNRIAYLHVLFKFNITLYLSFFFKENSIAAAHEKISECKKQILQAKRIRKNRQGKAP